MDLLQIEKTDTSCPVLPEVLVREFYRNRFICRGLRVVRRSRDPGVFGPIRSRIAFADGAAHRRSPAGSRRCQPDRPAGGVRNMSPPLPGSTGHKEHEQDDLYRRWIPRLVAILVAIGAAYLILVPRHGESTALAASAAPPPKGARPPGLRRDDGKTRSRDTPLPLRANAY